MNLNGKNKTSKTILNGKPLYGYDRHKETRRIQHQFIHQKLVKQSRTSIGKPSKEKLARVAAGIIMILILLGLIF